MPTRPASLALALLLALLLALPAPRPAAAAGLADSPRVAERLALFELWLGDQMDSVHQPGLSVAIVVDRELVWARGFGFADLAARRPAAPDTVYRLGSISKTFTAVAVLQLRDAGKLRLDDPVKAHLPWFEYRDRFPDGPRITVWNLLTHTSGLPRDAAFPYWTDRQFPTREQLIAGLREQEIVYEPGTHYKYSNLGLALAGEVVAAVSGESYADYLRAHVLAPLGMKSTFVETAQVPAERLATGYLARLPDGTWPVAPPTDARALTPSANLSSTVEDLARFVAAQFPRSGPEAGPLLSAATLREMHRVQWLDPDWSSGRGLGFAVWRQGARTLVGHGGWVAGHRAQIAFDPQTKVGVVVLTNGDEGGPGEAVRQLFELVAPALEKATASEPPAAPTAPTASTAPTAPGTDLARLALYTGAYHTPWGERSDVLVVDGELAIYDHSHPPTRDPLGSLTRLAADGEHAFRMTDDGNGERVVFELRPDGRVDRVKQGENYLYPEGCGEIGADLRCSWE